MSTAFDGPKLSMDMLAFGWGGFYAGLDYAAQNQVPIAVHVQAMEDIGWDVAASALKGEGVTVSHLMHSSLFSVAKPGRWAQERERLHRSLELVARLGSTVLEVTSGPAGALHWEEAADNLATAVAPSVAEAERLGVDIAMEPVGPTRPDIGFAHTLRDIVALARHTGVNVCLDSYWCWRENDLARTVTEARDLISLVQLSDNLPVAVNNGDRAVPGDGVTDFKRLFELLVDNGYDGYVDLEILGPRIATEGGDKAVTRGLKHLSSILRDVLASRDT